MPQTAPAVPVKAAAPPPEIVQEQYGFECPECGTGVDKDAKSCPGCGALFE